MPVTQETIRESTFTGRFYSRSTGQIVREVMGKNGKARAPRLIDMESNPDLVPSVTTVLNDYGGYDFLTAMTAIEYAQDTFQLAKEPLSPEQIKRIALDSVIDSSECQEFGTEIHGMCEELSKAQKHSRGPDYDPWAKRFFEWVDLYQVKPIVLEVAYVKPFYHHGKLWVGGTVDAISKVVLPSGKTATAVIDYKTQSYGETGPKPYPKWPIQMAPYDIMSGLDIDLYMSVVIPSRAAEKFTVYLWWDVDLYRQVWMNHLHSWYLQYGPNNNMKPEKVK